MKKAFTIMEVLVSIFIFVTILGVVIVNYGYSKKVDELMLVTFDLEDSIKFVQSMALTGQKIEGQIPRNGYGIILDKVNNLYRIYGDNSDLGFQNSDLLYSTTNFLDFNKNIKISSIKCTLQNSQEQELPSLDISFSSPRGFMSIAADEDISECAISISNTTMAGYWKIFISPNSSRVWSEFYKL